MHKTCPDCGAEFTPNEHGRPAQRCQPCRGKRILQSAARSNATAREAYYEKAKKEQEADETARELQKKLVAAAKIR